MSTLTGVPPAPPRSDHLARQTFRDAETYELSVYRAQASTLEENGRE